MSNTSYTDFVVEQQQILLPGWSLDSETSGAFEDAELQVIEKALKTVNTARQREAKAHLSKTIAKVVGQQLEGLQEERVSRKRSRQTRIEETGSLAVDPSEDGWTDSLPPEWPHAHSKAQAARYKELLSRVKELSLERAKLSEQRYVYQSLDEQLQLDAQSAADHVPLPSNKLYSGLETLTDLLRQSNSLPSSEENNESSGNS